MAGKRKLDDVPGALRAVGTVQHAPELNAPTAPDCALRLQEERLRSGRGRRRARNLALGHGQCGEVEGTSWFEALVPKERYPRAWTGFDRVMKEGVTGGSFENPILTKQGEERQILWRNTTLREGDRMVGIIASGMDVTDLSAARHRLEALSRRLAAVVRHAGASRLWIELSEVLRLIIRDDGRGFDANAFFSGPAGHLSFGLSGMVERASAVGGRVELHSRPGKGTQVRAFFPLRHAHPRSA